MTPSQKKYFHDIITAQNIDWIKFTDRDHNESNGLEWSILAHNPTGLYFKFSYNEVFQAVHDGGWQIEHTPGLNDTPKTFLAGNISSWDQVKPIFEGWVKLLSKEIHAFDFLNEMTSFRGDIQDKASETQSLNEPFLDEEKVFIRQKLIAFREEYQANENFEEDIAILNSKVDYLIEKLDSNYPKIDWLNIFVGTLASTVVSETLTIVKQTAFKDSIKLLFHLITGGRFLS